ncbi:MAG: DUF58 domain-containing protein [Betaproteobacteria bacterium]|nr:DUF58 domain-containing protein [Betaproteobacteria bacterium]
MLTGAINYGLALGHALVFLLASLAVVAKFHTFRNLYGLTVTPGRCDPVFVGETASFHLHFANDSDRPRLALELRAGDKGTVSTTRVGASSQGEVVVAVAAGRRGWLELPRVRLSTIYPLGLFVAWSYLQPAMRCLVYPRPLASELPATDAIATAGERRGEGGQEDFSGFRAHQPADSPRHVAWKAVARDAANRPLLVKQFAGGANEELMLDWQLTSDSADSETRIAIVAGWVVAADAEGSRYGLRLPGREIQPDTGPAHRHRCLEALALHPA